MSRLRHTLLLLAAAIGLTAGAQPAILQNDDGSVKAELDSAGRITAMQLQRLSPAARPIGFRTDGQGGPALLLDGRPLPLAARCARLAHERRLTALLGGAV